MKNRHTIIIFLLTLFFSLACQQNPLNKTEVRNLTIGEKVPDIAITKIMDRHSEIKSAKLSDFNNQLLILDFLSTRCGGCLMALPKMDSLQRYFGDKIKIFPVTYEVEADMRKYFNKNEIYYAELPWIIEDSLLSSWFRYKLTSHLVWIYKGQVKAITGKEYVNKENIQSILDGREVDWPVKADVMDYDYAQPIFNIKTRQVKAKDISGYSAIGGVLDGVEPKSSTVADTIKHTIRTYFINQSILDIYQIAWNYATPGVGRIFTNFVIWEVNDPSKYSYKHEYGYYAVWMQEHGICYESVVSEKVSKKERYQKVIHDMDMTFGIKGRWEKRQVNCLILVKSDNFNQIQKEINKDSLPSWRLTPLKDVITDINSFGYAGQVAFIPPVVDGSNFNGTIEFLDKWDDAPSLRQALDTRGFALKDGVREVNMFVVTKNP
ncbi:MAG: hypothetical protein JEZ09_18430 [Salinivirgaceae bacterium]|nr:hypothetical protein [Salinivirgaceae bacterium]